MTPVAYSTSLRTPLRHLALIMLAAWLLQLCVGAVGALPFPDGDQLWPSFERLSWPPFDRVR